MKIHQGAINHEISCLAAQLLAWASGLLGFLLCFLTAANATVRQDPHSKLRKIQIMQNPNFARYKFCKLKKGQCDSKFCMLHKGNVIQKCNAIQKCIAIQKWNNPKVPQSKSKSKNPKMQRSKSKCNDSKVSVTIQNRSNPKVQLQKFFINTDWKTSRLSIMIQSNPK